jgi:hypothetical protein
LQSSSVWSGKNGVENISGVLGDEGLQDIIKTDLYTESFNELRSEGILTGNESPRSIAALVEPTSQFGTTEVKNWINNSNGNTTISSKINESVRSAQYSASLVDEKLSEYDRGFSVPTGSTNTVSRGQIAESAKDVITEPKVTPPNYTRKVEVSNQSDPRRLALEEQVNNITKVEIPAAKEKYLKANPDKKFKDFLRSPEYKALDAKRDALRAQIANL